MTQGIGMSTSDDDYVYDEATGEWLPASEAAAKAAEKSAVRDAAGNVLADGDAVTLIKDLKVKGAGQTLKQGTVIRSIRLTDNPEEIDCRHDTIKGLVLRTEFVRKKT
jgi:protein PhnA